jgi:hypothetical protein
MLHYANILVVVLLLSAHLCIIALDEKVERPLSVPIEGKVIIPTGASTANYEVTLNGQQHSTLCRMDGTFTFHDIPSGIYLLDVSAIGEYFPQIKLKVSAEEGLISAVEYKYPGAKRIPADYPVVLKAIAPVVFFQKKPSMSIMSMLMANPMMLMMVFFLGVVSYLPSILKGIPQEELDEMTKNQAGTADPMEAMKKLMGMGGAEKEDDDE